MMMSQGSTASGAAPEASAQYSLAGILGIWAAAAVPMGLLAWVVFPALAGRTGLEPGILLWILMIVGLMWEVALSFIILHGETGRWNLSAIRSRTWRQQPRDPSSGRPRGLLWLWLIPAVVLILLVEFVLSSPLQDAWTGLFPFFSEPSGYSLQGLADTPEKWVGAWYLVGLMVLQLVGNYLWGEEFLFRSVLLPRMKGVFGRWDWVANALLFGIYHVHKPWGIPSAILTGIIYTYPSRRWRSAWFGLILHGADGLFFIFIILGLVLGLV